MDTSILEDLGLTKSEIQIYLTLLKLKNAHATQIIDRSMLQSSVVFRALNSLKQKGLINFNKEGKKVKNYQATNPEYFFHYIEEKRKNFESILPKLKAEQENNFPEESATIYKGIKGLKEVYSIMISTNGKEYITFGGGKACLDLLGSDWWRTHHQRRVENGLPSRQIFDETVKEEGEFNKKLPKSKVKYLTKEFAQFQETVIVGDYVAIAVFTENPYAFLIKDKFVAQGYKKHFEVLWKQANIKLL